MDITNTVFESARHAATKKAAFPAVVSVRYDRRVARIVISLASGLELAFSPKHAQGLENAHPADLMDAENHTVWPWRVLSAAGCGSLHSSPAG